jgi:hypothetical protein
MENLNQHAELSAEELQLKKDEMLKFYTESMPYLDAQYLYEKKLCEIDELRFKRANIQMQYAMMMTPPSEEDLEEEMNEAPKERKLKKQ